MTRAARGHILHDIRAAWPRFCTALNGAAVGAWVIVLVISPVTQAMAPVDLSPGISVTFLGYDSGSIYQQVEPRGASVLEASWAAAIYRHGKIACTGHGSRVYGAKLEPVVMTPDQWTGDTCDLRPGVEYQALATWAWEETDGSPRSVTWTFTFVHDPPGKPAQ